jgi:hypothetical protein
MLGIVIIIIIRISEKRARKSGEYEGRKIGGKRRRTMENEGN